MPHEIKIVPRFYKTVLQTRKKVLGSFLSNRLFATTAAAALFPKEKRKEHERTDKDGYPPREGERAWD